MRRRGLYIAGAGAAILAAAFLVVAVSLPQTEDLMNDDLLVMLLADVLDHVTDKRLIYPGSGSVFSYTAQTDAGMMWAIQLVGFEHDDIVRVEISDDRANTIKSIRVEEPAVFDILPTERWTTYYFDVENTGDRAVTAVMMFVDDPDNAELSITDPVFAETIVPLLASGVLGIIGITAMAVGITVFAWDWKKESKLR